MNQDCEAAGVYDDDVMKNGMTFVDGRQVLKDGALVGVGGIVGAARVNNVVYYLIFISAEIALPCQDYHRGDQGTSLSGVSGPGRHREEHGSRVRHRE